MTYSHPRQHRHAAAAGAFPSSRGETLTVWKAIAGFAIWLFAAELSRHFRFGGLEMSLVWPPDGIALGLVLAYGVRMVPPLALAVVCFNLQLGSGWLTTLIGTGALSAALVLGCMMGKVFNGVAHRLKPVPREVAFASTVLLPFATTLAMLGSWQFTLLPATNGPPDAVNILLVMFLSELFGALLFTRLTIQLVELAERHTGNPGFPGAPVPWLLGWWLVYAAILLLVGLGGQPGFELLGASPRYLLLLLVAWAAYQGSALFVQTATAVCGVSLLVLAPAPVAGSDPALWVLDQALLVMCVSAVALVVSAAQAHQRQTENELLLAAHTDSLTGCLSERGLLSALADRQQPDTLLGLDIVNLNHVESLGGIEGARNAELHVANILRKAVPEAFGWARARDGWFVGMIPTGAPCSELEEALRTSLSDHHYKLEGRPLRLRTAIGWLHASSAVGLTPGEQLSLLALACQLQADNAQGAPVPNDLGGLIATRRAQITHLEALREALRYPHAGDGPGLWLAAQPIQSACGKQPDLGVEILLRWRDGPTSNRNPGEFLPLAEQHGLMPQIDRWVIRNVCQLLAQSGVQPDAVGKVSINLSGLSMSDPSLADHILEQVRASGFPPGSFCFEVTESTGFAERTAAIDTLQRLRQAGIHTALDDFGTGLATFDYLKSLPLDVVKIDGSFIRHIATSRADQRIVEAVCMVASTLGLRTVAEFVETPDQRALLAAYGVDQVQGYGIARPVPFVGYLAGLRSGD